MGTSELPGMWEESNLYGGEADETYVAPGPDGRSTDPFHGDDANAILEQTLEVTEPRRLDGTRRLPLVSPEAAALEDAANNPYAGKSLEDLGDITDSAEYRNPDRRLPVRAADAAQYAREAIPEEQRGQIRVRLLNATPDPLGSIAALCEQYKGHVIRSLAEVTDEQRRACLSDMASTVLNGPLEAAQFHFQIEGVTRSITHQMVRSRASFFAQESLRFAVPEGNWAEEIPLPPSLSGKDQEVFPAIKRWKEAMRNAQESYAALLEWGVPAEEARGVLPHDMPTRIHWVVDLRTLLAEAGKRTCTQAQFPWRVIFAGIANALRFHADPMQSHMFSSHDAWQFREIANRLRPVCYQTGSCGFMAKFDRSCSIRARVDANASIRRPSSEWGKDYTGHEHGDFIAGIDCAPEDVPVHIPAINDAEWALDPSAARS